MSNSAQTSFMLYDSPSSSSRNVQTDGPEMVDAQTSILNFSRLSEASITSRRGSAKKSSLQGGRNRSKDSSSASPQKSILKHYDADDDDQDVSLRSPERGYYRSTATATFSGDGDVFVPSPRKVSRRSLSHSPHRRSSSSSRRDEDRKSPSASSSPFRSRKSPKHHSSISVTVNVRRGKEEVKREDGEERVAERKEKIASGEGIRERKKTSQEGSRRNTSIDDSDDDNLSDKEKR
jgi:hypothetical protein